MKTINAAQASHERAYLWVRPDARVAMPASRGTTFAISPWAPDPPRAPMRD